MSPNFHEYSQSQSHDDSSHLKKSENTSQRHSLKKKILLDCDIKSENGAKTQLEDNTRRFSNPSNISVSNDVLKEDIKCLRNTKRSVSEPGIREIGQTDHDFEFPVAISRSTFKQHREESKSNDKLSELRFNSECGKQQPQLTKSKFQAANPTESGLVVVHQFNADAKQHTSESESKLKSQLSPSTNKSGENDHNLTGKTTEVYYYDDKCKPMQSKGSTYVATIFVPNADDSSKLKMKGLILL